MVFIGYVGQNNKGKYFKGYSIPKNNVDFALFDRREQNNISENDKVICIKIKEIKDRRGNIIPILKIIKKIDKRTLYIKHNDKIYKYSYYNLYETDMDDIVSSFQNNNDIEFFPASLEDEAREYVENMKNKLLNMLGDVLNNIKISYPKIIEEIHLDDFKNMIKRYKELYRKIEAFKNMKHPSVIIKTSIGEIDIMNTPLRVFNCIGKYVKYENGLIYVNDEEYGAVHKIIDKHDIIDPESSEYNPMNWHKYEDTILTVDNTKTEYGRIHGSVKRAIKWMPDYEIIRDDINDKIEIYIDNVFDHHMMENMPIGVILTNYDEIKKLIEEYRKIEWLSLKELSDYDWMYVNNIKHGRIMQLKRIKINKYAIMLDNDNDKFIAAIPDINIRDENNIKDMIRNSIMDTINNLYFEDAYFTINNLKKYKEIFVSGWMTYMK